jgi:hypothetical protein
MEELSKLYKTAYNAAVLCYYSDEWETTYTGANAITALLDEREFTLNAKGLLEAGSLGNIIKRSLEIARNEICGFAVHGAYVLEALAKNNERYGREIVKHKGLLDYFVEVSKDNINESGLPTDTAKWFLKSLSKKGQGEAVAMALLDPKRPQGAGEKKAPEQRPGQDTGR